MRQLVRRWRRRFSFLHAPRLTVRVAVPWYLRWLGVGLLCSAVGVAAWWFGQHGPARAQPLADPAPLAAVPAPVAEPPPLPASGPSADGSKRERELEQLASELRTQLAAAQSQSAMDKASQAELTKSLAKAQEEIARLKEDLALYQSSLQAGGASTGVSVQNFKVEAEGSNRYRYRLLLTHKSQRATDFKGQGLMNVGYERDGKLGTMVLKQGVAGTSVVELRFKYYQQIEGTFQVDEGTVLKKVEFVVFEEGKNVPLLTTNATL